MMEKILLSDICDFINGGAWSQKEYAKTGCLVLQSSNFKNGKVDLSNCKYLNEISAEKYKKHRLHKDDLVIATVGSHPNQPNSVVGKFLVVPNDVEGALLNQNTVCLRVNSSNVLQKYIGYLGESKPFKYFIISRARGTANQVRIAIEELKKFKLFLPPLPQQKKIADILSAYDDLIANNNRRIKILETMAAELYTEWFVRFRFPNYENSSFQENGLPNGWQQFSLREVIEFYIGGGWGKEEKNNNFPIGAYVIRGTDIPKVSKGILNKEIYRYHKSSNVATRNLKPNDIIFEVSGGTQSQLLGRNVLISQIILDRFNDKVICASFCKLIRSKDKMSSQYLKCHFDYLIETEIIGQYQVQSTGICNFQFEVFLDSELIVIPNEKLLNKFDAIIHNFRTEIDLLGNKNTFLQQGRDSLLPRLLSGKLLY